LTERPSGKKPGRKKEENKGKGRRPTTAKTLPRGGLNAKESVLLGEQVDRREECRYPLLFWKKKDCITIEGKDESAGDGSEKGGLD